VSSGESQSTAPLPVLDPDLLARLPRTPPAAFQARMLEAMEASRRGVQVVQLDPTVRLIAMSQRDASDDNDIDNALRSVETSGVQWSSLTWSALRDARPPFSPPPTEWGGELSHLLDGDAGLIFFIDIEAIAVAVSQAAEQLGLTAIIEDDGGVVRVSDGRFQAMLGTSTIIAEALWTGCGPLSSLVRRVRQVPHELRSFVSVMKALERTYVGARFEVVGDHLLARRATGAPLRIDYRHLAAAARASGVGGDTFLQGALLEDLTEQPGEVVTLLRSPAWARAWPEMLSRTHDDGGVVCVAREVDGRVRAVPSTRQDRPERLAFLEREARRQLPFMQVTGHAFVVEQPAPDGRSLSRVFGLVSDRSASLLLDPALLRGFYEQLGPVPGEIDVATTSENVLVVAPRGTATVAMTEALRRGSRLEVDLLEDGADPLVITKTVSLPAVGAGHFDLTVVPDEYFALSDQAAAATDLSRINGDYVRGLALEAIGLHDKAVSSFERAVRARNDDGEVNLALGRALSAVGNYERAVSVLNRASGFLPEHAELQNALGVAHYKTGASTHARAAFLRAVHLSPDEVGFLVNLGRTCCDEEMFTEAQAVLEHALRMEPSSAEAHASMAVLCHRTGNRPQALHHARAALAEEPDDDTVQELLRMIDDDVEPGIS
jgi:Flp pilus assembly protein TadD